MPYSQLFSAFAAHLEVLLVNGGYAALFLGTLLEGLPLVGMVVPGHIIIILSGFLAKVHTLDLAWVLPLSVSGAVIGDCIGYWFGHRYGMSFIDRLRPYFFLNDAHLAKASELLSRHTGKAMIIGRFNPVTRALMPFLVGAHRVPSRTFWVYNIIGAVSWVTVSVGLGYVFGAGYHAASSYFGKLILAAFIGAAVIAWGYRFINLRFHIFARYELFALALNLLSLYMLARTIQDAWSAPSFLANFDISVNLFMAERVGPLLERAAWWVSTLGGIEVMVGLAAAVGVVFAVRRRWRLSAIMVLSVGSTAAAVGILKEFFLRSRPENALGPLLDDPSFPSAHAALSAAFFIILAYFAARYIRVRTARELAIAGCTAAAAVVGLSRLILNVHWASDVIAGWALGAFLATGSILLVRYVGTLASKKLESR